MKIDVHQIKKLVTDFQFLNHRFTTQRWQNDHVKYIGLLSGWRAMQVMRKYIERNTAPAYNVFYVMKNMDTSEVKLHSPFLADLFNINGEHKQGDLFYNELVKIICQKLEINQEIYIPKDKYWMSSATEVWSGSGGIDILLTYRNGVEKFAIAIENKINAGDQENQLKRYYEYLEQEFEDKFILAYLTIDGKQPSSFSAPQEFIANKTIPCISYREDIVSLLEKTIPKIAAPIVRSTVEQYLELCQNL